MKRRRRIRIVRRRRRGIIVTVRMTALGSPTRICCKLLSPTWTSLGLVRETCAQASEDSLRSPTWCGIILRP
jgi:hypothetical protein